MKENEGVFQTGSLALVRAYPGRVVQINWITDNSVQISS